MLYHPLAVLTAARSREQSKASASQRPLVRISAMVSSVARMARRAEAGEVDASGRHRGHDDRLVGWDAGAGALVVEPIAYTVEVGPPASELRPQVRTAGDVLESFEARTTPFDPRHVSFLLWELKRGWEAAGKNVPVDLHAEWLAFTFTDNHAERGSERSAWGTYYGPV